MAKLTVPEGFWRRNQKNMAEFKARKAQSDARGVPEDEWRSNQATMAQYNQAAANAKKKRLKGKVKVKRTSDDQ